MVDKWPYNAWIMSCVIDLRIQFHNSHKAIAKTDSSKELIDFREEYNHLNKIISAVAVTFHPCKVRESISIQH